MSWWDKAGQSLKAVENVVRSATYDITGKAPHSPLMVYVELTRRCNSRCKHCDIWQTASRVEDIRSLEIPAEHLVELLCGLVPRGLMAVDLFGGEPLLRDDLTEVVHGLTEAGLHVTVTTNGTLMDRERADGLVAAGLDQLLVSIDGPNSKVHDRIRGGRGLFTRAVKGVQTFLTAGGKKAGLNALVCADNIDLLPEMVELTSSLGASQLRLLPYHQCYPFNQYGQDDSLLPRAEDLPRLGESLELVMSTAKRLQIATNGRSYLEGIKGWYAGMRPKVRCMAGLAVCDINAFGNVYPCYTLAESVGNIGETSFPELWTSQRMERHRKATRECDRCWQSCYIEPGLRLSPRTLLQDRQAVLHDVLEYFLRR